MLKSAKKTLNGIQLLDNYIQCEYIELSAKLSRYQVLCPQKFAGHKLVTIHRLIPIYNSKVKANLAILYGSYTRALT
jgi:hypothetical protein